MWGDRQGWELQGAERGCGDGGAQTGVHGAHRSPKPTEVLRGLSNCRWHRQRPKGAQPASQRRATRIVCTLLRGSFHWRPKSVSRCTFTLCVIRVFFSLRARSTGLDIACRGVSYDNSARSRLWEWGKDLHRRYTRLTQDSQKIHKRPTQNFKTISQVCNNLHTFQKPNKNYGNFPKF